VIRRSFRIGLTLGLLGGLVFALTKMLGPRPVQQPDAAPSPRPAAPTPTPTSTPAPVAAAPTVSASAPERAPAPEPAAEIAPAAEPAAKPAPADAPAAEKAPPKKAAAKKAPAKKKPLVAIWVEPTGGVCPTSHPVKAKLASKIFHLPGMLNYDRTKPDRCYRDATGAEGDGLRPAKR